LDIQSKRGIGLIELHPATGSVRTQHGLLNADREGPGGVYRRLESHSHSRKQYE
jgi:hypothetical protein